MLELKKIGFEHAPLLKKYADTDTAKSCDRTCGTLLMWRDYFDYRFDEVNGTLIISSGYGGYISFAFPLGADVNGAFEEIDSFCIRKGIPLVVFTHNDGENGFIERRYGAYTAYAERMWFDYVYDAASLRDLTGKKYAAQRNHINRFERDNPDYLYKPVEKEDIPDLLDYVKNYRFHSEKDGDTAQTDLLKCTEVLSNFETYGFSGGVLRVGGKTVGFTLGEVAAQTLFVHIEKADVEYSGIYQMLSNSYLRQAVDGSVKYVNREDDSGDLGLRKSKLSYHPEELIIKTAYTIDLNTLKNRRKELK